MKTLRFLLAVLLVFFAEKNFSFAAEQFAHITTKEGREYKGTVLDENKDEILLKTPGGVEIKIPRAQISIVEYLSEHNYFEPYPVLGLTIGLPGGINLVSGYYYDNFGFRAAIGFTPETFGFSAGPALVFGRTKHFSNDLRLVGGYAVIKEYYEQTWAYGGLLYGINFYGFSAELGLSVGHGDFNNPQVLLSAGYVYEFR